FKALERSTSVVWLSHQSAACAGFWEVASSPSPTCCAGGPSPPRTGRGLAGPPGLVRLAGGPDREDGFARLFARTRIRHGIHLRDQAQSIIERANAFAQAEGGIVEINP